MKNILTVCACLLATIATVDFATAYNTDYEYTVLPSTPVLPLGDTTTILARCGNHAAQPVGCTREQFLTINNGDRVFVSIRRTGLTRFVIRRCVK